MTYLARRTFLSLAGSAFCIPQILGAQVLPPVRLMVVRRPAVLGATNCTAPCIRGSIYDVSNQGVFAPATWTVPLGQEPICDVIERPWLNNAPNISAIPAGAYDAFVRSDATKGWMTNENRAWRIQLRDVNERSAIQFHYGQDEKWSEGCFIVGDHIQSVPTLNDLDGAYCKVENGEAAVARLRAAVTSPSVDSSEIKIFVSDRESLFGNATQGC